MSDNCTLTRIYSFSAAHRLQNDKFSDEMNKQIFGKCNNPNGHGHDYYLELTVSGDVSPDTGMIINIEELDFEVHKVIDILDHKRLDIEIDYFINIRICNNYQPIIISSMSFFSDISNALNCIFLFV